MEVARVWEEGAAAAAAKSLQSCPTVRPHRWQPTRLPRPWDSPGEGAVGSYCLTEQFQFCKMKRVLEMDGGDGCMTT